MIKVEVIIREVLDLHSKMKLKMKTGDKLTVSVGLRYSDDRQGLRASCIRLPNTKFPLQIYSRKGLIGDTPLYLLRLNMYYRYVFNLN